MIELLCKLGDTENLERTLNSALKLIKSVFSELFQVVTLVLQMDEA
jgi:hypothetical protein